MNTTTLKLKINGQEKTVSIDPRTLLVQLIRDHLGLTTPIGLQLCVAYPHLSPEALDVGEHVCVLATHPLDDIEPAQHVVEALRAEDDLDCAAPRAVDVEGAKPRGDRRLGGTEALLRELEMLGVRRELRVDRRELGPGAVVRLRLLLDLALEDRHLCENGLRLGLLRADRRVGLRRRCGQQHNRHHQSGKQQGHSS